MNEMELLKATMLQMAQDIKDLTGSHNSPEDLVLLYIEEQKGVQEDGEVVPIKNLLYF